jgi:hypothetical protein
MATAEVAPQQPIFAEAQQFETGVYSRPESMVLPPQQPTPVNFTYLPTHVKAMNNMPDARPSRLQFAALRDPRLRMKQAIPLDVTVEEGHVVVNWAAIDEFGSGENLGAAIDDFAYALRALYRYLNGVEELGPDLANAKRVLGEYIEKR